MAYSIPDCFMTAFVCGTAFGLVYEFFRIVRKLLPLKAVIFVCDVCFFIAAAFFVFNLSMYIGNYVRSYTMLGFGAGVFAYIQTIGRVFSFVEDMLVKLWKKTIGALIYNIFHAVKKGIGSFAHIAADKFMTFHDFSRRTGKKLLTPLKFVPNKMYNVKRNIVSSERNRPPRENNGGKNVIQAKIRRGP